ncbi:DUF6193 family natural product biosynthesis protein [Streptomyces sp. W16]|uniref:DUF6193 family natural product biosynthesis protein n=1 Tax=Streptomyces sp. W16 TaxID=3076631 RepID=UPI00295B2FA0|nr:DUF6193 family natural product biosynthesis protein [Streptomyces sp. W16]MDV9174453.1 DUF6193 family natural product biosynthesis protein [Streptomyces sp. W16]
MPTPPAPSVLYPDVATHGSLAAALRDTADGRLDAVPVSSPDGTPLMHATVGTTLPHRESLWVSALPYERKWSIRGTESFQHLALVDGDTDNLAEVVEAARAWHDGASLDEIRRAAPFVHLTGRFEVPDRDPARLTESEWQHLRREADELEDPWRGPQLLLAETAYAEPALRALYPFRSHWVLRFATDTRPSLIVVGPSLFAHNDGTFGVGRSFMDSDLGRFATAHEAVAEAVRHLPSGLGPVALGG